MCNIARAAQTTEILRVSAGVNHAENNKYKKFPFFFRVFHFPCHQKLSLFGHNFTANFRQPNPTYTQRETAKKEGQSERERESAGESAGAHKWDTRAFTKLTDAFDVNGEERER